MEITTRKLTPLNSLLTPSSRRSLKPNLRPNFSQNLKASTHLAKIKNKTTTNKINRKTEKPGISISLLIQSDKARVPPI